LREGSYKKEKKGTAMAMARARLMLVGD